MRYLRHLRGPTKRMARARDQWVTKTTPATSVRGGGLGHSRDDGYGYERRREVRGKEVRSSPGPAGEQSGLGDDRSTPNSTENTAGVEVEGDADPTRQGLLARAGGRGHRRSRRWTGWACWRGAGEAVAAVVRGGATAMALDEVGSRARERGQPGRGSVQREWDEWSGRGEPEGSGMRSSNITKGCQGSYSTLTSLLHIHMIELKMT